MKKIYNKSFLEGLELDDVIRSRISQVCDIIDEIYGADRNHEEDDGGYCVLLEEGDVQEDGTLPEEFNWKIQENIEHCEVIKTENGEIYFEVLTLVSNEKGYSFFVNQKHLSEDIRKKLERQVL